MESHLNVMVGGEAIGLCGSDFDLLAAILRKEFKRHGEKVVEDNVIATKAGFDFAREHGEQRSSRKIQPISGSNRRMLLNGNEALLDEFL